MKRLILSSLLTGAIVSAPLFAPTKTIGAPAAPAADAPVTLTPLPDVPAQGPDKPRSKN